MFEVLDTLFVAIQGLGKAELAVLEVVDDCLERGEGGFEGRGTVVIQLTSLRKQLQVLLIVEKFSSGYAVRIELSSGVIHRKNPDGGQYNLVDDAIASKADFAESRISKLSHH
jgi:hypothetical protein